MFAMFFLILFETGKLLHKSFNFNLVYVTYVYLLSETSLRIFTIWKDMVMVLQSLALFMLHFSLILFLISFIKSESKKHYKLLK